LSLFLLLLLFLSLSSYVSLLKFVVVFCFVFNLGLCIVLLSSRVGHMGRKALCSVRDWALATIPHDMKRNASMLGLGLGLGGLGLGLSVRIRVRFRVSLGLGLGLGLVSGLF
jgi:hypothetical protein